MRLADIEELSTVKDKFDQVYEPPVDVFLQATVADRKLNTQWECAK